MKELTQEGQEASKRHQCEIGFHKRPDEIHELDGFGHGRDSTLQCQVPQYHQAEHHERADSHGPSKADFRDEILDHDGENNSSNAGSCGRDAERERPSSEEVGDHARH